MRAAGPEEVWNQRDRIRSVPSAGDVMEPSKLFSTANPMSSSRVSPEDLPCQNSVKSLSLTDPVSDTLVSWSATMFICSLLSSLSMTAVFRASLTS